MILQKNHPAKAMLKAVYLEFVATMSAETNKGDSPLPKSSNKVNRAKADPLVSGTVELMRHARMLAEVNVTKKPAGKLPITYTFKGAGGIFTRAYTGKAPTNMDVDIIITTRSYCPLGQK